MKKKKASLQTTWWFDPVYCCNFWIVAGCSGVELHDYIATHISKYTALMMTNQAGWNDDSFTAGRAIKVCLNKQADGRDAHGMVIWSKKPFTGSRENYATLAHEAVHAAAWQLDGNGIHLSEATEEAYTYYVEHIVRNAAAGLIKSKQQEG